MAVFDWADSPKVKLGRMGAEAKLSELEEGFLDTLWKFAEEEMRPIGQQLDRMTPEEVAAPDSPF